MHYIAKVLCKGNPFHGPFSQYIYIYIIKGSLDEKLPSYELLKMLKCSKVIVQ